VEFSERVQYLLHRLVDELVQQDEQIDAEWERVFRRVHRHHFVPQFLVRDAAGEPQVVSGDNRWLEAVYSNRSLFTSLDPDSLSSSSAPGLMARFLTLLDVHDGCNVLEIGTATGYNAALLCQRLGSDSVTTIDIVPEFVEIAQNRLNSAEYTPTVATADGALGYQPNAPYDRINATCGVPKIPDAWIDQLKPNGVIVAPLQYHPRLYNGQLMSLRLQTDGSLIGRGDAMGADFMPARSEYAPLTPQSELRVREFVGAAQGGYSRAIEYPTWFANAGAVIVLSKLRYPGFEYAVAHDVVSGRYPPMLARCDAGSWARVEVKSDGIAVVTQGGPEGLWDILEETRELWQALGSPWLDRYGMTITNDRRQYIWLDSPDSEYRWEL
jgi:protein-L-isoaspartate(D-aspartate) O-methyltransferase